MKSELEETLLSQIIGVGLPTPLADCKGDDMKIIPGLHFNLDFVFPNEKLVVMIKDADMAYDEWAHIIVCNAIAILGYAILTFTSKEIRNGYALKTIQRWFVANTEYIPF